MITSLRALAGLSATLLAGCNTYLFEQKCPQQIKEQSIVQPAATPTPADILFVVDNSGSMADEQENLARNFEAFIREIAGPGDYQLMVVSTDVSSPMGETDGLQISTFANDHPKNLIDLSAAQCTNNNIAHGCARGPDPALRIISSMSTPDAMAQVEAFKNNVRIGSCGSGIEQGLAAMKAALEQSRPGGCNEGFLRDGANLVVVIVSDEQDTDNTLVDQYVSDLGSFKPWSKIRVAMVVGAVDGVGTNCRIPNTADCGSLCRNMPPSGSRASCTVGMANQCPSGEFCQRLVMGMPAGECESLALQHWTPENCAWCSFYNVDDCCSALSGSRYVDFAKKVEGRVIQDVPRIPATGCTGRMDGMDVSIACLIDSICQENFSATLARIARELVLTNTFTLDPAPVFAEGVVVKVKNGRFPADGKQLVYGTDFTIEPNAGGTTATLTIGGMNTPVQGEDVEIYYVVDKATDTPKVGACGTSP